MAGDRNTHKRETPINPRQAMVRTGSLPNSSRRRSRPAFRAASTISARTISSRYPSPAKMTLVNSALFEKKRTLDGLVRDLGSVIVAYSGGVDSAYLTATAHEVLGNDALAVTAVSPSLSTRELKAASRLATDRGWNHTTISTYEMHREEYARNAPDRCYWCKTELFEVLAPLA